MCTTELQAGLLTWAFTPSTTDVSSPLRPSHAFAQWRKIGEEKDQKAFTVAGPCGNFTRFPILLLPEIRRQAPEAKTVLLRRRLIYTERRVMEMLRRGVYENY